MKREKELIDIVKENNFKTFWHCFDFLLIGGYSSMESFSVSMKVFTETQVFSSVAFTRLETNNQFHSPFFPESQARQQTNFIIGIIDDKNMHLDGLYNIYRKWLNLDKLTTQVEIEETAEVLKFSNITPFILKYLHELSKLHFGFETFNLPKIKEIGLEKPQPPDFTMQYRRNG